MSDDFDNTQKAKRLRSYLSALPSGMALKLLSGLERAVIAGEDVGLPIEFVRGSFRPLLRSLEGARPGYATAQRLFCLPFEDMLVNGREGEKVRGIVPRASIDPVWEVIRCELLPDTFPDLIERVTRHILNNDYEARAASLSVMRRSAAAAILEAHRRADADPDYRQALLERIGGRDIADDALDMAHALLIGDEIVTLQENSPVQMDELDESRLRTLRTVYERVYRDNPDQAPYVAFAAMGRMTRPWQILRLVNALAQRDTQTLKSRPDLVMIDERLLGEMEALGDVVSACWPGVTPLADITPRVLRLADIQKGMGGEIDLSRVPEWRERMFKVRQLTGQLIEGHLARFETDLHAALPLQRAGAFSQGAVARVDLSRPMSVEKAKSVKAQWRFVVDTLHRADVLGVRQTYLTTREVLESYLKRYTDALLEELRLGTVKADGEPATAVFAGEMLALLEGSEAADVFRRRVRAAMRDTA